MIDYFVQTPHLKDVVSSPADVLLSVLWVKCVPLWARPLSGAELNAETTKTAPASEDGEGATDIQICISKWNGTYAVGDVRIAMTTQRCQRGKLLSYNTVLRKLANASLWSHLNAATWSRIAESRCEAGKVQPLPWRGKGLGSVGHTMTLLGGQSHNKLKWVRM